MDTCPSEKEFPSSITGGLTSLVICFIDFFLFRGALFKISSIKRDVKQNGGGGDGKISSFNKSHLL